MPYSEPTNLGIVACPGGQAFASEVIAHLRHMLILNEMLFQSVITLKKKIL